MEYFYLLSVKNNVLKGKESGGICDSDPRIKVEFCGQFLPMLFFGYKFTDLNDEALICKPNTFWIVKQETFRIRRRKKLREEHYQLEMYSCPDIFYRDLESDTDILLDEKYHVSQGREKDSAIVFFQKHKNTSDDKIYPQKYIQNIAFQRLIPQQRADADLLTQIQQPYITLNPIQIEEELIAYWKAVKLNKRE